MYNQFFTITSNFGKKRRKQSCIPNIMFSRKNGMIPIGIYSNMYHDRYPKKYSHILTDFQLGSCLLLYLPAHRLNADRHLDYARNSEVRDENWKLAEICRHFLICLCFFSLMIQFECSCAVSHVARQQELMIITHMHTH